MSHRRYRKTNSSEGCLSIVVFFVALIVISELCSSNSSKTNPTPTPAQISTSVLLIPRTIPTKSSSPQSRKCDPSYPDVCLLDGIGDYDCAGGSGNGPNYIRGPFRVLPPDPFGLDRDHDGLGCE